MITEKENIENCIELKCPRMAECDECWGWSLEICGVNCPQSSEQMQKTNGSETK